MKKYLFLITWVCFYTGSLPVFCSELTSQTVLKFNIFSRTNGKGLENDRKILSEALSAKGYVVFTRELGNNKIKNQPDVDVNIFF